VHGDYLVIAAADVAGDAVEIEVEKRRRREALGDAVVVVANVVLELLQPEFVDGCSLGTLFGMRVRD
jgi:hypothetical protein